MGDLISYDRLASGCSDASFDGGIVIDAVMEPLGGPMAPVKPPTYIGGVFQTGRRWATPDAAEPVDVVVLDSVPSQANRVEAALQKMASALALPEFVLDLASAGSLPAHLPKRLSSWEFPHRVADAYLRDSLLGDSDFTRSDIGRSLLAATPALAGPLAAWFPQALLFGFWQSHLGNKRAQTKSARAWQSEVVGWEPAVLSARTSGTKGDPLNLTSDVEVIHDKANQLGWEVGKKESAGEGRRLSEVGHGQVPFGPGDGALAAVSFRRITQRTIVSFAALRRVSLGPGQADADAAMRALIVALGLHGFNLAFGRATFLRSGADLRVTDRTTTWLGSDTDEVVSLGGAEASAALLAEAVEAARSAGVPLDGWVREPLILRPKPNLVAAIEKTWPKFDD